MDTNERWYTKSIEEVEDKLGTNIKYGLTEEEVIKRRNEFGQNVLQEQKKDNIIIKFFKQFNDFMIIILIIASIISAYISYIQGENDYIDSIIIIAIVFFNSIMGLVQEEKAEKSIESLKKLTPKISKVIRDGHIKEIDAEELVPGDIIELTDGSFVPADCRIIESYNLKIEESSLTGENEPVEKENSIIKISEESIALGDMKNMAFMGSIIVLGHGKAIVTETGMNTKIGKIANMIIKEESPETPIQKKLSEVGKILGIVCLIICIVIFLIGFLKKIEPIEMFMTSVGLAVAAIPEGLPAIVTIVLSIGVTKMAKKNSIIRKLPAVETLGSSNVICSDKTGTLTQNKMTVVKTYTCSGDLGNHLLLELGSMCTDCIILEEKELIRVTGESTEIAIINKSLDENINKNILYKNMPRINEIPFDSNRKMMTTLHKTNKGYKSITKGAPEIIIDKCNRVYKNGRIEVLTELEKRKIKDINENMASEALRVLAVAYRDIENMPGNPKLEDELEKNLIFVGLVGMIDPPRDGVKEAVDMCKKAGIKIVMITGDNISTAKAIAKKLNILGTNDKAMTGNDLDKISDIELERCIEKYSVFARVTPEHKVRIVKAWQKKGKVVAMTGDGVNDSPALKNADIGIAMGKIGTDVAKNASDMILVDDNFVTIVEAVKQGRNIYDNIKKAIHFLLATNIGEIVTIFLGLILGLDTPLLAIQLLWINLVTDSFPAIALGLEKEEENIMNKKPRDSKESIFADGLWSKIITEGIMIGVLTLVAFTIGTKLYGLETGRTMAFICMGMLELVHSFNIKSDESIFKTGIFENKYLVGSFFIGLLMQIIVVIIPIFADLFELVNLDKIQWVLVFNISIIPLFIIEIQKFFNTERNTKYRVIMQ